MGISVSCELLHGTYPNGCLHVHVSCRGMVTGNRKKTIRNTQLVNGYWTDQSVCSVSGQSRMSGQTTISQ